MMDSCTHKWVYFRDLLRRVFRVCDKCLERENDQPLAKYLESLGLEDK